MADDYPGPAGGGGPGIPIEKGKGRGGGAAAGAGAGAGAGGAAILMTEPLPSILAKLEGLVVRVEASGGYTPVDGEIDEIAQIIESIAEAYHDFGGGERTNSTVMKAIQILFGTTRGLSELKGSQLIHRCFNGGNPVKKADLRLDADAKLYHRPDELRRDLFFGDTDVRPLVFMISREHLAAQRFRAELDELQLRMHRKYTLRILGRAGAPGLGGAGAGGGAARLEESRLLRTNDAYNFKDPGDSRANPFNCIEQLAGSGLFDPGMLSQERVTSSQTDGHFILDRDLVEGRSFWGEYKLKTLVQAGRYNGLEMNLKLFGGRLRARDQEFTLNYPKNLLRGPSVEVLAMIYKLVIEKNGELSPAEIDVIVGEIRAKNTAAGSFNTDFYRQVIVRCNQLKKINPQFVLILIFFLKELGDMLQHKVAIKFKHLALGSWDNLSTIAFLKRGGPLAYIPKKENLLFRVAGTLHMVGGMSEAEIADQQRILQQEESEKREAEKARIRESKLRAAAMAAERLNLQNAADEAKKEAKRIAQVTLVNKRAASAARREGQKRGREEGGLGEAAGLGLGGRGRSAGEGGLGEGGLGEGGLGGLGGRGGSAGGLGGRGGSAGGLGGGRAPAGKGFLGVKGPEVLDEAVPDQAVPAVLDPQGKKGRGQGSPRRQIGGSKWLKTFRRKKLSRKKTLKKQKGGAVIIDALIINLINALFRNLEEVLKPENADLDTYLFTTPNIGEDFAIIGEFNNGQTVFLNNNLLGLPLCSIFYMLYEVLDDLENVADARRIIEQFLTVFNFSDGDITRINIYINEAAVENGSVEIVRDLGDFKRGLTEFDKEVLRNFVDKGYNIPGIIPYEYAIRRDGITGNSYEPPVTDEEIGASNAEYQRDLAKEEAIQAAQAQAAQAAQALAFSSPVPRRENSQRTVFGSQEGALQVFSSGGSSQGVGERARISLDAVFAAADPRVTALEIPIGFDGAPSFPSGAHGRFGSGVYGPDGAVRDSPQGGQTPMNNGNNGKQRRNTYKKRRKNRNSTFKK